jgi:hypothetical protein
MEGDMNRKILMVLLCVLIVPFMGAGICFGGSDLDDGISKFTDESISQDDKIGKSDTNVNFIILNAIATAKAKQKKGDTAASNYNDGSGDNNENSVVIGAGTTGIREIYNINISQ